MRGAEQGLKQPLAITGDWMAPVPIPANDNYTYLLQELRTAW